MIPELDDNGYLPPGIHGASLDEIDRQGQPVREVDFMMLFNAHHEDMAFVVPAIPGEPWQVLIDTASLSLESGSDGRRYEQGGRYALRARTLVLFSRSPVIPEAA